VQPLYFDGPLAYLILSPPLVVLFMIFNPLTPTFAIWIQLKCPVLDWFKLSFVIFDIRAL